MNDVFVLPSNVGLLEKGGASHPSVNPYRIDSSPQGEPIWFTAQRLKAPFVKELSAKLTEDFRTRIFSDAVFSAVNKHPIHRRGGR